MKRFHVPIARRLSAMLIVLLLATTAWAQIQSGNIFGRVLANDGSALPGVTVTLHGVGAPQTTVTDGQGNYRFLNLSPGSYSVQAELAGYGTANRTGVSVNLGRNAEVAITLNPSVSDTITVTAEAPLLDTRRTGTGSTVSQVELDKVPTARDPWVILQQVPGVLMDRMNVGGNESGQQSNFVSKGANGDQATFSVDGVNTTDMSATGSSSSYFDFGSFEELQVTTGGTDPRVQTPGAQINMVTKRGTNDLNGSARYILTDGGTQGERKIPSEAAAYIDRTNEINEITEWGVEAGGPIIRDRLWMWGAYADNKIDLFTAQPPGQTVRYTDNTSLETINAKLNAQLTRNNSATIFYTDNEKVKFGRNASPQFPPESTWNQSGFGPSGTYKIEDTHIFSSNFYLTGLYSRVNGGFQLQPHSGANCESLDCVLQNADKATVITAGSLVRRNTYQSVQGERPQDQYRLDGSAFVTTGALNHELKFGFGYRTAAAEGLSTWPQNQLIYDLSGVSGLPKGFGITYFYSISPYDYKYEFGDAYLGDTILWGNLTLQAGLRFDTQKGTAADQITPGNSIVPEYLPSITYRAEDTPSIDWQSISPRIGLTYALGSDKKTLLRAAYNQYVGQLGGNSSGYNATLIPGYQYVMFYTLDADGNDVIRREEILFDEGVYYHFGFDLDNIGSTTGMRRVDPDLKPQTTDELILGFEHELLTDFVVSANYTHRQFNDFSWYRGEKTRGSNNFITTDDYVLHSTITPPGGVTQGGSYSVPVYRLKDGVANPQYFVLTNRDGYNQTYDGLELGLVKRMANRWLMRGNVSWNDWKQNVDDEAIVDPTPLRGATGCSVCDDAAVTQGSGLQSGARGGVWINSKWSVNLAGVYQIPFIETNLGMNFNMRQGYPVLYVHQVNVGTGEATKQVLVDGVDSRRLENPYSLDFRLSKDFRFRGVGLELAVDAFNVTNQQTVLQRNATLVSRSGAANNSRNRITELQNPRVLRFGARMTF